MATLRVLARVRRGWNPSAFAPCFAAGAGRDLALSQTSEAMQAALSPASSSVMGGGGKCSWGVPDSRPFRSSAAAFMPEKLTIVVPSMGDSIVEGTICAVLKQQGDAVAEDEIIAQIETDKVTVDVRAPKNGTISSFLVKEDENVEIGQTVAHLIPGEAPAGAAAADVPVAAEAPSPETPAAAAGRAPLIRFPPRIAPSGERLSALSAADQQAALQALTGASTPAASSEGMVAPSAVASPAAASSQAPKTTERLSSQPDRYPYTDREMECIMLGGADGVDINIAVNVRVVL